MKRIILLTIIIACALQYASAQEPDTALIKVSNDTIVRNDNNDLSFLDMIAVPWRKPKEKVRFEAQSWGFFTFGFNNFVDNKMKYNSPKGIELESNSSYEININFIKMYASIKDNKNLGYVTGLGIRWNRYFIDGNYYLKEIDGITALHNAPDGIVYKKSRIGTTSLVIPFFIEYKIGNPFFVSFGPEMLFKTASSSKVQYYDSEGKKHKEKIDSGMNINPVTFDLMLQIGFRDCGLYAKYSPMSLFEKDKGPIVHPVSVGISFDF